MWEPQIVSIYSFSISLLYLWITYSLVYLCNPLTDTLILFFFCHFTSSASQTGGSSRAVSNNGRACSFYPNMKPTLLSGPGQAMLGLYWEMITRNRHDVLWWFDEAGLRFIFYSILHIILIKYSFLILTIN